MTAREDLRLIEDKLRMVRKVSSREAGDALARLSARLAKLEAVVEATEVLVTSAYIADLEDGIRWIAESEWLRANAPSPIWTRR